MHPITVILLAISYLWIASEIALAVFTRAKRRDAIVQDAGSLAFLWGAIALGIGLAMVLRRVGAAAIPLPGPWIHGIALLTLAAGLAIRWTAIITLGRFFTASVTVSENHRLVRSGFYRYVRHPSYTGLLIAFLGVAASYGNWLALPAVLVPVVLALHYRIRVEESALVKALGDDYVVYCKSTKRLIPGVY